MKMMMRRFAKWILRDYITDTESFWFEIGANQAYYEPETVKWVLWSSQKYWEGEE
jgi:hypothetical protein